MQKGIDGLCGDARLHHAVVLFRGGLGAFQAPAVEAALGLGGFQFAIFLDGRRGKPNRGYS